MSHFAGVNSEDKVLFVVVVPDECEHDGDSFMKKLTKNMTDYADVVEWIQTSYNTQANEHLTGGTPLRGNFAGIGFSYLREQDVFIDTQPYESWILDESTWRWAAPISMPTDKNIYLWNESNEQWDLLDT